MLVLAVGRRGDGGEARTRKAATATPAPMAIADIMRIWGCCRTGKVRGARLVPVDVVQMRDGGFGGSSVGRDGEDAISWTVMELFLPV